MYRLFAPWYILMRDLSRVCVFILALSDFEFFNSLSIFSAINGLLSKIALIVSISFLTFTVSLFLVNFPAWAGLIFSSKLTKSSYTCIVKSWNETTGNVGESPASVLKVQYWLTLKGILGKEKGAVAIAEREKDSSGFTIFTILWTPAWALLRPVEGISLAVRGSASTTMPAFFMASANKLSSSRSRGSMKCISKVITSAPASVRISVKRAWSERGHLSGLSGTLKYSEDSLSILTTTTSEGACLAPLSLNNKPRPESSSILRE